MVPWYTCSEQRARAPAQATAARSPRAHMQSSRAPRARARARTLERRPGGYRGGRARAGVGAGYTYSFLNYTCVSSGPISTTHQAALAPRAHNTQAAAHTSGGGAERPRLVQTQCRWCPGDAGSGCRFLLSCSSAHIQLTCHAPGHGRSPCTAAAGAPSAWWAPGICFRTKRSGRTGC